LTPSHIKFGGNDLTVRLVATERARGGVGLLLILSEERREDVVLDLGDSERGMEMVRERRWETERDLFAYCLATASGENFNMCSFPLWPNSTPKVLQTERDRECVCERVRQRERDRESVCERQRDRCRGDGGHLFS
jgi:hypothetical protein